MIEAAQERLERWLLSGQVVRREPGLAGGVISWLDRDGRWNGLYPEIAGYCLLFCTLLADAGQGEARARRVAAWLDSIAPDGEPPTIILASGDAEDWRNRALFSFDLAIILRGLLAARSAFPGSVPDGLLDRVVRTLGRLDERGQLASHRTRRGGLLPEKWSTTQGCHHVKAAAALLAVPDPRTVALAHGTAEARWAQFLAAPETRHPLHPLLYFVEGWLIFWSHTGKAEHLERARLGFDSAVVRAQDWPLERGDVIAQMLRAGTLLDAAGLAPPAWPATSEHIASALLARIAEDGGLTFNAEGHKNAWAGLFAWQALDVLLAHRSGRLSARGAARTII